MASLDTTSPDVLRKAIIARLGIDPKKLAGFQGDPGFDTNITNLYRNETNRLGGYDTQEARLGSDYGTALANLNYQNDQASKNLMGTLADRGMAFSGAAVQGQADQAKQYQDQLNSLNTQRTRGLEDIGTARNNVNYDLLNQRGKTNRVNRFGDILSVTRLHGSLAAFGRIIPGDGDDGNITTIAVGF